MTFYFIFDTKAKERRKKYIRKMQTCDLLARMALAYGNKHLELRYSEIAGKPFWNFDSLMPCTFDIQELPITAIRWYIENHIQHQDKIWNGSYLKGLSESGKIHENQRSHFLTFTWHYNERMYSILESCPFGCSSFNRIHTANSKRFYWGGVPALSLPYDKNSVSYMAGILSTGRIMETNDATYAVYAKKVSDIIRGFGVPVEKEQKNGDIYISPFWPALVEDYMADPIRIWKGHKKGINANLYASILWKIYTDDEFKRDNIPYLLGRRATYYKYKQEDIGAIRYLKKQMIELRLIDIDKRFKNLIQEKSDV